MMKKFGMVLVALVLLVLVAAQCGGDTPQKGGSIKVSNQIVMGKLLTINQIDNPFLSGSSGGGGGGAACLSLGEVQSFGLLSGETVTLLRDDAGVVVAVSTPDMTQSVASGLLEQQATMLAVSYGSDGPKFFALDCEEGK